MNRSYIFIVVLISLSIIVTSLILVKISFKPSLKREEQKQTETIQTPKTEAPNACKNTEPLKHVYNPKRLKVFDTCKSVSGEVVKVFKAIDGDIHINLKVDPPYQNTLNEANYQKQEGNLVVEIVCVLKAERSEKACLGYENKIPIPNAGDQIIVIGQFVTDTTHGWNQIHPAYQISPK